MPFHDGGKRTLAFEAHGRQACALLEQALHMLAVILVLLVARLVGVDVGVARHADDVGVLDRVHREDVGREHLDRVLEQDELETAAGQLDDALALMRQRDQAEDHAFCAALFLLVLLLFLAFLLLVGRFGLVVKTHQYVELAVFQMRERMGRIDDLRREERLDVVLD